MGQYYRPCVLKKNWKQAKNVVKATLDSWDFDNGLKLMEHSWIGNGLVRRMEYLLANQFKGYPFVWSGDYADTVVTKKGNHNIYDESNDFIYKNPNSERDFEKSALYKKLLNAIPNFWDGEGEFNPYENIPYYRYLVNYSKKEYCVMPKHNSSKLIVNPLPILTCDGNGRGGGDYRIEDERIGSWAFDRIGLTNDNNEIVGFKEIDGFFEED